MTTVQGNKDSLDFPLHSFSITILRTLHYGASVTPEEPPTKVNLCITDCLSVTVDWCSRHDGPADLHRPLQDPRRV
ncbi:hypothetical protein CEP53_005007 [Fusarium sp. AF-6]|nr:hypothetical protein CEP53_005007 [Fusarium sp. AF-6]